MHKYLTALLFGLSIIFAGHASAASQVPDYSNYPIKEVFQGPNANLDFTNNGAAKKFESKLKQAAQQKPNFAGHYVITSWGCGAFCSMIAIIDVKNGKVYMPQFEKDLDAKYLVGRSFEKPKVDSNLLVIKAQLTELPRSNPESLKGKFKDQTVYYLWKDNKPKLLLETFSQPYKN